MWDG
jgi:hypothetical protein